MQTVSVGELQEMAQLDRAAKKDGSLASSLAIQHEMRSSGILTLMLLAHCSNVIKGFPTTITTPANEYVYARNNGVWRCVADNVGNGNLRAQPIDNVFSVIPIVMNAINCATSKLVEYKLRPIFDLFVSNDYSILPGILNAIPRHSAIILIALGHDMSNRLRVTNINAYMGAYKIWAKEAKPNFDKLDSDELKAANKYLKATGKCIISYVPVVAELAINGESEFLDFVLKLGANPNVKWNGMPALHCAICRADLNTIKTLVEAGADLTALDTNKNTPLHMLGNRYNEVRMLKHSMGSRINDMYQLTKYILTKPGVNVLSINKYGHTPIKSMDIAMAISPLAGSVKNDGLESIQAMSWTEAFTGIGSIFKATKDK